MEENDKEREGFVLGEDVSARAKARRAPNTAVLSVRLSIDEIAGLERIARSAGKTTSQVVREAIASYKPTGVGEQPIVTVSTGEFSFTVGEPGTSSSAGRVAPSNIYAGP